METIVHNPGEAAYKRKIDEMRECVAGRRGWVRINFADAKACDVSRSTLEFMAMFFGLRIYRHGRYGWVCARFPN